MMMMWKMIDLAVQILEGRAVGLRQRESRTLLQMKELHCYLENSVNVLTPMAI